MEFYADGLFLRLVTNPMDYFSQFSIERVEKIIGFNDFDFLDPDGISILSAGILNIGLDAQGRW